MPPGRASSSSTSVPLSFQAKPTIRLIDISLVSMFMMDRLDSSNCWCDVQSRAPEIIAGLKPLRGIDTGSPGGRQSNTDSPTISAGFCSVRIGTFTSEPGNRRVGLDIRRRRRTDVGVAPYPVTDGSSRPPGDGRMARRRCK